MSTRSSLWRVVIRRPWRFLRRIPCRRWLNFAGILLLVLPLFFVLMVTTTGLLLLVYAEVGLYWLTGQWLHQTL